MFWGKLGAVQKLASNSKTIWEKTPGPVKPTTKKSENVNSVCRDSKIQRMNYLLLQQKWTAVKRPRE